MALKRANVKEQWGFQLGTNWHGHNFTFIDFGMHYHEAPMDNTVIPNKEMCPFRAGVYIVIFGVMFRVGKFWDARNDEGESIEY